MENTIMGLYRDYYKDPFLRKHASGVCSFAVALGPISGSSVLDEDGTSLGA